MSIHKFNATALDALTAAGTPAYLDQEEGFVIAHPADVPKEQATAGHHVTVARGPYGRGYCATAWESHGNTDFLEVATVFEGDDLTLCVRAVAEWFTTPRPTAGAMLLAALAQWDITAYGDGLGMSYAIPLDPATPASCVHHRPHLSVGDSAPSVEHVPASHTGWVVSLHDEDGSPVGDPLFNNDRRGLVDCAADSAAAAEVIADYFSRPTR
ncbi:hypothetical protein ACQEVS_10275 [Streptomyces sp. CA-181903]|uniref:hypothetical protein n=1 Tax=Streptomyces sp. CA-181903 TaxID=3240055 RepID=UPI003D89DD4E